MKRVASFSQDQQSVQGTLYQSPSWRPWVSDSPEVPKRSNLNNNLFTQHDTQLDSTASLTTLATKKGRLESIPSATDTNETRPNLSPQQLFPNSHVPNTMLINVSMQNNQMNLGAANLFDSSLSSTPSQPMHSPLSKGTSAKLNSHAHDSTPPNTNGNGKAPKKTRNKLIKSCLYCRRRKLKCNKQHPMCGTCLSRNFKECIYLTPPVDSASKANKSDTTTHSNQAKQKNKKRKISNATESILESNDGGGLNTADNDRSKLLTNQVSQNPAIGTAPFGSETINMQVPGEVHDSYSASTRDFSDVATERTLSPLQSQASHTSERIYQENALKKSNLLSIHGKTMPNVRHNKILDLGCLTLKNERYMYFGATSVKSSVTNSDSSFLTKLQEGWKEYRKYRMKGKRLTKYSLMREIATLERTDKVPTMERMLQDLPPKIDIIDLYVDMFFKSSLHKFFHILSEQKVKEDVRKVFKTDSLTGKIVKINFTGKKNFYTVGVILMILAFTFYDITMPSSLLEFFVFLEGITTGKPMFVERAQFLCLKTLHRIITGCTGGDGSHLLNLVGSLCTTVIGLGFHRDVYEIYQRDVDYLGGDVQILKNIFYWTLFADLFVSTQYGKQLFITPDLYVPENLLLPEKYEEQSTESTDFSLAKHQQHDSFDDSINTQRKRLDVLKLFLYHMRCIVAQVYQPLDTPDVLQLIRTMSKGFDDIFMQLEKYFVIENNETDLFDYLLLPVYFQLQLALSSILMTLSNKNTTYAANNIIKFALSTMKVCTACASKSAKQQKLFKSKNKDTYQKLKKLCVGKYIEPDILLAPYVRYTTLRRAILEYYKVLYKATAVITEDTFSLREILQAFIVENSTKEGPYKSASVLSSSNGKDTSFFHSEFSLNYLNEEAMDTTKFCGLQLYKWFCVHSDELFLIETKLFVSNAKFSPEIYYMKAVEKVTKMAFKNFVCDLQKLINGENNEGDKQGTRTSTEVFSQIRYPGKGLARRKSLEADKYSQKKNDNLLRANNSQNNSEPKTAANERSTTGGKNGHLEHNPGHKDMPESQLDHFSVSTPSTTSHVTQDQPESQSIAGHRRYQQIVDYTESDANSESNQFKEIPFLPGPLDYFFNPENSSLNTENVFREIDVLFESFDFQEDSDLSMLLDVQKSSKQED